jgi:RNAse (barnase) inhibitor barstar
MFKKVEMQCISTFFSTSAKSFLGCFEYTMTFQSARFQTQSIHDWDSFHSVFAETLSFPSYYGFNMNAWIDCMTDLDDADAGMTTVTVAPGELFHLEVEDTQNFQKRVPEIFQAFIECAAFVNMRRIEQEENPVLALILL